eukprot:2151712-Pleurochrysis_carterae.AAC.1
MSHWDFVAAYLQGYLERNEVVYCHAPPGYATLGADGRPRVCRVETSRGFSITVLSSVAQTLAFSPRQRPSAPPNSDSRWGVTWMTCSRYICTMVRVRFTTISSMRSLTVATSMTKVPYPTCSTWTSPPTPHPYALRRRTT